MSSTTAVISLVATATPPGFAPLGATCTADPCSAKGGSLGLRMRMAGDSKYFAVTRSPTLTWLKFFASGPTLSVTTLPLGPFKSTVRLSESIASTVAVVERRSAMTTPGLSVGFFPCATARPAANPTKIDKINGHIRHLQLKIDCSLPVSMPVRHQEFPDFGFPNP